MFFEKGPVGTEYVCGFALIRYWKNPQTMTIWATPWDHPQSL